MGLVVCLGLVVMVPYLILRPYQLSPVAGRRIPEGQKEKPADKDAEHGHGPENASGAHRPRDLRNHNYPSLLRLISDVER